MTDTDTTSPAARQLLDAAVADRRISMYLAEYILAADRGECADPTDQHGRMDPVAARAYALTMLKVAGTDPRQWDHFR